MTFSQYEEKYGEIISLVQTCYHIRVWKKIFLRTDPFNRTSYIQSGAESCNIVNLDPSDRGGSFALDFGIAELIIPAGALIYGVRRK